MLNHALKEIDVVALAVTETTEQVIQILGYVIDGSLSRWLFCIRRIHGVEKAPHLGGDGLILTRKHSSAPNPSTG